MSRSIALGPAVALVFALSATATRTFAQVEITNLGDKTCYVARYTFIPYSPNTSAGLPAVTEAQWRYVGWWPVAPGETYRGPDAWYYVECEGQPILWENQRTSTGFVRPGPAFDEPIYQDRAPEGERALRSQGFKQVQFMLFENGHYRISGNAFKLVGQVFNFQQTSRDPKTWFERFPVNGAIAHFDVTLTKAVNETNAGWVIGENGRALLGSGYLESRSFAGPRTQAEYTGYVDIKWTVPNR
jgi:hypothetical protein